MDDLCQDIDTLGRGVGQERIAQAGLNPHQNRCTRGPEGHRVD